MEHKGNFGVFSLFTMIVGIIIGSGIFIKNATLITMNGSIGITMVAWAVASILCLAIVISFIEILSITERTGEQANLSNWGRHLVGDGFSKFMGVMMGYIFLPILMCVLFSYTTMNIISTLGTIGWLGWADAKWKLELFQICVTLFTLVLFAVVNSYLVNPGKYFQNIGTSIKTIPLFFMIILFISFLIMGDVSFDQSDAIATMNKNEGFGTAALIFITIPPILFSFDGFLIAGLLSKEAKDRNTFRIALIMGMIFIIVIYVLFSVSVFGLGEAPGNNGGDFGYLSNAIFAVFANESIAKTVTVIMSIIIVISILTGASGCNLAASRIISDLSANNIIEDKNAKYVKLNNKGVPTHAGFKVLYITLIWLSIFTLFDMIAFFSSSSWWLSATDYTSNLSVITAFFIYVTVIVACLVNRFTNKTEVEKNILFWPSAIISIVLTLLVTFYFAFVTLLPMAAINGEVYDGYWIQYSINICMLVIYLGSMLFITLYISLRSKYITDDTKMLKFNIINENKKMFGEN